MDKELILAVAGAGKTTELINRLNLKERFFIITYTNNNYESLKKAIEIKFGYIPINIKIFTYFTFLYDFCFKPFEITVLNERNFLTKGIEFQKSFRGFFTKNDIRYYIDMKTKKVYSERLSLYCMKPNILLKIKNRIEKYTDNLFIDEIQDFGGNDFNFILELLKFNLKVIFVGDFYQHTYDTSRDCSVNKNLFDDFNRYKLRFKNCLKNLNIDEESFLKTKRCSEKVCEWIRENLGIEIHSDKTTSVEVRELSDDEIERIIKDDDIVKLFYNKAYTYIGNVSNWGASKGLTYMNICVVLNQNSYKLFKKGKLNELPMITKNKLYVACTRTLNNLYFVSEKKLNNFKK